MDKGNGLNWMSDIFSEKLVFTRWKRDQDLAKNKNNNNNNVSQLAEISVKKTGLDWFYSLFFYLTQSIYESFFSSGPDKNYWLDLTR